MKTRVDFEPGWRGLPWILGVCLLAVSCRSAPLDIPTSIGTVEGDLFGEFRIVGVSRRLTVTGNQDEAPGTHDLTRELEVQVPVATELIVPVVQGWLLGFGSFLDGDDAQSIIEGSRFAVRDHHYGVGYVNVKVADIGAPEAGTDPPTRPVTIAVDLALADNDGHDDWAGFVSFHLLYLARQE